MWREELHPRGPNGEFAEGWLGSIDAHIRSRSYSDGSYDDVEIRGTTHGRLSDRASEGVLLWQDDSLREELATRLRKGRKLRDTTIGEDPASGRPVDGQTMHDALVQAVSEGRLSRDVVLYRGITGDPNRIRAAFQPGTVVRDQSFMATSFRRSDAEGIIKHRLAYGADGSGFVLKILARKGTMGAPGAVDLQELLLLPGTATRVIGWEDDHTVVLEVGG